MNDRELDFEPMLALARRLRAVDEDRPSLLCTVVGLDGASCGRIGARLLLVDDGAGAQWVSDSGAGGWVRGELVRRAWWSTRDGSSALIRFDSTDGSEIGQALELDGDTAVDLLLEPCHIDDPLEPLAFLEQCWSAGRAAAAATVFRSRDPRVGVGTRLHLGPDGVARSTLRSSAPAWAALEAKAQAVLASGSCEVYRDAAIEALVEAIVPSSRAVRLVA